MYTFGSGGGNNSMSVNVLPQGGLLYDTMLSGLLGENRLSPTCSSTGTFTTTTLLLALLLEVNGHYAILGLTWSCEDKSRISTLWPALKRSISRRCLKVSVDYLLTGSFTATCTKSSAKVRGLD